MTSSEKKQWSLPEEPISREYQDGLQRAVLVEAIAGMLIDTAGEEGSIYSISGNWGVGKTSVINLVKNRIKNKVDYLDFKPWALGAGENITRELFNAIRHEIKGTNRDEFKKKEKWGRAIGAFLQGSRKLSVKENDVVDFFGKINKGFGVLGFIGFLPSALFSFVDGYSKYLGLGISAFLLLVGFIGKRMFDFYSEFSKRSLDDYQFELKDLLNNRERQLVVFIDDIDRLDKDEIRALIRQVKGGFNFKNIKFVLIYQQSIVEAALTDGETIKGKEFLEKIILCNFVIPPVPVRLVHNLFNKQLNLMLQSLDEPSLEGEHFQEVVNACVYPYIRHVRDVKRLLNAIYVNLQMHRFAKVREVNMVDFIGLEAIKLFAPVVYAKLYKSRRIVLREYVIGLPDVTDKELDSWFSDIRNIDHQLARQALEALFPKIKSGRMAATEAALKETKPELSNCVFRSAYFDLYFHFQRFPGEVSQEEVIRFIKIVNDGLDVYSFLAPYHKSNTLRELYNFFMEYTSHNKGFLTVSLLSCLFAFYDFEFHWEDNSLSIDVIRSISQAVRMLDISENLSFFDKFTIDSYNNLLTYLIVIAFEKNRLSKEGALEEGNEDKRIALEQKVLERVKSMSNNDDIFLRGKHFSFYLFYWNVFESQRQIIDDYVRKITVSVDGFNVFLDALRGFDVRDNGDFFIIKDGNFHYATLRRFFEFNELESRLDGMNFDDYPEYKETLTLLKSRLVDRKEIDLKFGSVSP